jgi:hypothetical protein
MTDHPDGFRTPNNVFNPDPRNSAFAVLDEHGFRPMTLEDRYKEVAPITLHEGVPRQITAKFDNARNLSLMSWYVYRFHSAARSHAYECLELALRMRFKDDLYVREEQKRRTRHEQDLRDCPCKVKGPYKPINREKFRPTLHPLLQYAIEIGALKNEHFSAWQQRTNIRARHRRDIETIQKMKELGLSELEIDDTQLEINDEDRDHDYLGQVLKSLPSIRNLYAHGTSALDNKSLSALRITAEIINQLFAKNAAAPGMARC